MISETNHSRAWSFILPTQKRIRKSTLTSGCWQAGFGISVSGKADTAKSGGWKHSLGNSVSIPCFASSKPVSSVMKRGPRYRESLSRSCGADAVREWGVQPLCVCREGDSSGHGPGPGPLRRRTAWMVLLPACSWRCSFLEGQWFFENFFDFFLSCLLD